MPTASEEELLVGAARTGELDASEWPRVLEHILKRLNKIIVTDFPFPSRPTTATDTSASTISFPSSDSSRIADTHSTAGVDQLSQPSSDGDKENAAPSMPPPAIPTRRPPTETAAQALGPYPDLEAQYQSAIRHLTQTFPHGPPFTIQRLAELVLEPRRHYRYLPPFINALSRVVSVSSSTTNFPLPQQSVPNGILHVNGGSETGVNASGDEGLGGALLTPIPWLRHPQHSDDPSMADGELHTEGLTTIDGPNGVGSIETVSVTMNGGHHNGLNGHHDSNGLTTEQELREQGAVTQGELLRQEQEAGVIPVTQIAARRGQAGHQPDESDSNMDVPMGDAGGADLPHARGPEEIGMEDLGPQSGEISVGRPLDLEAALGRSTSDEPTRPAEDASGGSAEGNDGGQGEVAEPMEPASST